MLLSITGGENSRCLTNVVLNKIKQTYLLQNFSEPLLREGSDLLSLSNYWTTELLHRVPSKKT